MQGTTPAPRFILRSVEAPHFCFEIVEQLHRVPLRKGSFDQGERTGKIRGRVLAAAVSCDPCETVSRRKNASQVEQKKSQKSLKLLAVPAGVEPATFGLGNRCSIR
jgi:hypothetical protein